jgi:hypothetical protein
MHVEKSKWLPFTRFPRCLDSLLLVQERVYRWGLYYLHTIPSPRLGLAPYFVVLVATLVLSRKPGGFSGSPRIVTRANVAIGLFLTTLLNGCAINTSIPAQSFERIEIIALDSETSADAVPSKGKSAATGAAAGAIGGLTASLLGSLACGPYFPLCFAATAPATIGATMLVGGAMGMSGISDDDATKITPYLETLQANHNMSQELATALAKQFPLASLAPPGVADARISLDVNSLRLMKVFGQKPVFSLTVATQYEWNRNKPNPQHSSRKFMCETRLQPIDEWVNDDGATIQQELNYCIEDLARRINKALTELPPTSVDGFSEFDVSRASDA